MKTMMLPALMVAVIAALAYGFLYAQHGHAPDPEEHFELVSERPELSEAQQEMLAQPFGEAFAAMEELHRLHGVISKELTEAQKEKLEQMIHESLGVTAARAGDRSHR